MKLSRRQSLQLIGSLSALGLSAGSAWARPGGRVQEAPSEFLEAVIAGRLEEVRAWLKRDPSLATSADAAGRSAFVLAHLHGRSEVAEQLSVLGLELDLVEAVIAEDWKRMEQLAKADPGLVHAAHPVGGTPLYAAALVGSLGFWRLRGLGCDPDLAPAGGSGLTPARGALESLDESWARISLSDLCGNGSDINAPQPKGDSVLHACVARRSELLLRLAIRKGADVLAKNAAGQTPLALAQSIKWQAGVGLLENQASLPRDNRSSRKALDADGEAIEWPDLSSYSQAQQSEVTGNSHMNLKRVKELVSQDRRLVFSLSTDDELPIEASAHLGSKDIIRYHLDQGAPFSLPSAVSLGDEAQVKFWLDKDPTLIHERGAHDFPLMWFVVYGGASISMAELLLQRGASLEQESMGTTALHCCVERGQHELAEWLLVQGADREAIGFKGDRRGNTPLELAQARGDAKMISILKHG